MQRALLRSFLLLLTALINISVASNSYAETALKCKELCGVLPTAYQQKNPDALLAVPESAYSTLPENGYLSVDVLLVIYTHSILDTIDQQQIDKITSEVEEARRFYARNSFCRFNINIANVEIIDRLLTLDQFEICSNGGYGFPFWEVDGIHSVQIDLYDLGYADDQFSSVFVFYAWENKDSIKAAYGGIAYGVYQGFMGQTAYACVPYRNDPDESDWLFIHEFHHNLDQMFYASGLPEYPHADFPENYNHAVFDDGYSFNGWMLRDWPRDNWALMSPNWGTVHTFIDADGDSIPDFDTVLAIDEERLGSSTSSVDTDSDGLNDMEELAAGYNLSADPGLMDTDSDGIFDGDDIYPLDDVEPYLYRGEMVIDGILDNPPPPKIASFGSDNQSDLWVEIYSCYSDSGLFFFFDITDDSVAYREIGIIWNDGVRIRIDAMSDGFWHHSDDNFEIVILPHGDSLNPDHRIRILLNNGDYGDNLLSESDLNAAYRIAENGYTIEMFFRENLLWGFFVNDGWSIRLQCDVLDYDINLGWPIGFPRYNAFTEFLNFEFGGNMTDVDTDIYSDALPGNFSLSQNYPNPFNATTRIEFSLLRTAHASIKIFNILGQKVKTLVDEQLPAGHHSVFWDGYDERGYEVATGIYFYSISVNEFSETKKMVLLR